MYSIRLILILFPFWYVAVLCSYNHFFFLKACTTLIDGFEMIEVKAALISTAGRGLHTLADVQGDFSSTLTPFCASIMHFFELWFVPYRSRCIIFYAPWRVLFPEVMFNLFFKKEYRIFSTQVINHSVNIFKFLVVVKFRFRISNAFVKDLK